MAGRDGEGGPRAVMHATLSPTRPISPEEKQAINDLRTILPTIDCLSDNYVVRWLRAKDLRFDETAESLKKHVVFRKAWELDRIGKWHAPECLEKYCGYGFLADKEGSPILMSLLGNMDVEGFSVNRIIFGSWMHYKMIGNVALVSSYDCWTEHSWSFIDNYVENGISGIAEVIYPWMSETYYISSNSMKDVARVYKSGLLKSVASLDYIKFSLSAIEKGLQLCEERAEQTGRPFEQMMLVFDLDHIGSAHFSSKQFASSFTTLVTLFQEHYPLVLRKILIIRAPEMARIAYQSITAILSDPITRLIEMPSEADWKWALAQYVDLDAWPMHWGGRRDENGDPKCPSVIRYGLGPIPDNYYVDPRTAMADYDQLTTVYAGDKHLISIRIKEPSKICWQYMTEEDDIGFEIHYDPSSQADNLTEMETVYPYIRLECTSVPISGHFVAEKAGNYVIEFDNYYSWFSAKQLRYNIEIEEM